MVENSRINSFSCWDRLTNAKDYRFVFARPIKSTDSTYTILARPNKLNSPRLGVIVGKKFVRGAVQRNRLKRIVRESFRTNKHVIGSFDVVVICKKNSAHRLNKQLFYNLQKHWNSLSTHAE